jgi:hypothetical protein
MFITVIKFIELRYFNAFIKSQPENVPRTPFLSIYCFCNFFAVTKPYVFFLRKGKDKQKYMIGYTIVFSCYFDRLTFILVLWNYKLYKMKIIL